MIVCFWIFLFLRVFNNFLWFVVVNGVLIFVIVFIELIIVVLLLYFKVWNRDGRVFGFFCLLRVLIVLCCVIWLKRCFGFSFVVWIRILSDFLLLFVLSFVVVMYLLMGLLSEFGLVKIIVMVCFFVKFLIKLLNCLVMFKELLMKNLDFLLFGVWL